MYCSRCGSAVDEGGDFCANCGAHVMRSPVSSVAPQVATYATATKKKSMLGYALSLIGGALTFLAGVGYFMFGVPVAGVLGIIFAVAVVIISRRLHAAPNIKSVGIIGTVPTFIGLFMLVASGTLLPFDIGVSIAGLLIAVGNSAALAGR